MQNKLQAASGAYQAAKGAGASDKGVGHPGPGFVMPAGSNGRSSGPALPISKSVDEDVMEPSSGNEPSDDSGEDSSMVKDAEGGKIPGSY